MTASGPLELEPLEIAVLTVSDTRDEKTDKSGALLVTTSTRSARSSRAGSRTRKSR